MGHCPGHCVVSSVPHVSSEDAAVKGRLVECLETVLNKAQEPPKSKKVQHSNAKNAILFETISLIIHYDRCLRGPDSRVLGDGVWERDFEVGGRCGSGVLP